MKQPNLILINSNDKNAFAATYVDGSLNLSNASDFRETNNSFKKPDKLINCVYELSGTGKLKNADAVSVTVGPGSFTGIRVGLSIAKGLAFGLNLKIIPINNFDLSLNRVTEKKPDKQYCVLIQAKQDEYYYSIYENTNSLKSGILELADLSKIIQKDTVIVGDFDDETSIKHSYFKYINVKNLKSEQDSMLELTLKGFEGKQLFNADEVEPLYLMDFKFKTKTT